MCGAGCCCCWVHGNRYQNRQLVCSASSKELCRRRPSRAGAESSSRALAAPPFSLLGAMKLHLQVLAILRYERTAPLGYEMGYENGLIRWADPYRPRHCRRCLDSHQSVCTGYRDRSGCCGRQYWKRFRILRQSYRSSASFLQL